MRVPLVLAFATLAIGVSQAAEQDRYYAYEAERDRHGVIAPWYIGQNGQLDFRVGVAAETLKRYPWCGYDEAVRPAPHYVPSGAWSIAEDGTISIPPIDDWSNGDLGQRAAYVLSGLVDYYRYSGDAAAIAHLYATADTIIEHCVTGRDHPWPGFLISVPVKGKPYGPADPKGFIQTDITAEVGLGLLRAYQLTGERRWLDAVREWADLLAEKRTPAPGAPWGRYANPEDALWEDTMTGGIAFILFLFDELIRLGYTGEEGAYLQARQAGIDYLREELLPRWTEDQTWGRNYWDWPDPVQAENVTEFVVRYMMRNPKDFPNWQADCRNILTLFINRTCVAPSSNGDCYSGAWAYPESSGCCGRSLWYGPMELATTYAELGVRAGSEWAREMARRQIILATYDAHDTGVVEDNIDGGQIVAGAWFKIAHPMALKHVLGVMEWQPDLFGPARENHIMRSTAVVRDVHYGDGVVRYRTFDAPEETVDVLRLAFRPSGVTADGTPLQLRGDLSGNGYTLARQDCGDWIVQIRHDGLRSIEVTGDDPQTLADDRTFDLAGEWGVSYRGKDLGGSCARSSTAGATAALRFTGNQVRLYARFGPMGGKADVYLDGRKQLAGIDCWAPRAHYGQVAFSKNSLWNGEHELKVVVLGEGNPLSAGAEVMLDGAAWSDATGRVDPGMGGGPSEPQRWILGYPRREPYVDTRGNSWVPGTEIVVRAHDLADVVKLAWWDSARQHSIAGTDDPELYRYGIHARDFTAYATVAPGTYHVRVRLCETRRVDARERALSIAINGEEVASAVDVAATAGGYGRAADLVFDGIEPKAGVIELRFVGSFGGEAAVQALEFAQGPGGEGASIVQVPAPVSEAGANLLVNGDFELGVPGTLGRLGERVAGRGWQHVFAGPDQAYIWAESAYAIHPDWGPVEIRSGVEAIRTHGDHHPHTIIYQDVPVEPNTTYYARVWVNAADVHGAGFGHSPGDAASLRLQELRSCGKVLVDHAGASVTTSGPYRELTVEMTTGPETAQVRLLLDTRIGAPYDQAHVTYDDAELVKVE